MELRQINMKICILNEMLENALKIILLQTIPEVDYNEHISNRIP